jgi:hypothetical protein
MAKQLSNFEEIHRQTEADIRRRKDALVERRAQIVAERAKSYASALKSGNVPTISADERAAREHAKNLLNGSAPDWLCAPPGVVNRDSELLREQMGIDIALEILSKDELAQRAAEAVAWAEQNAEKWQGLCHEIVLTAVKLKALERTAGELVAQCGDIFAVRMPLLGIIEGARVFETPIGELIDAALADNLVTKREIREIEKANSNG